MILKGERLLRKLGGLLKLRRRSGGPVLPVDLQCERRWIKADFMGSDDKVDQTLLTNEQLDS